MADYEIAVAHLYGNLMNTYGDYGNIIALTYYAKQIGVAVDYHLVSLGDEFNATALILSYLVADKIMKRQLSPMI